MLPVLKLDHGSAWLSGQCRGEKVEILRGQGIEWTNRMDIDIIKNHDRRSEEESHKQGANNWRRLD